jgi:HYR domain-containing protein
MRKLLFVVLFALVAVLLFLPAGQAGRGKKIVDGVGSDKSRMLKKDAVSHAPVTPQKKPSAAAQTTQTEEELDDDPDLPPGMNGKIDKETYLRARGDYIDMLRGRDGIVPPDARENAIKQMDAQEAATQKMVRAGLLAPASLTNWTFIGPAPIPNGQTSAISTPVSGRTIAIAVHPTDPDTVYVGAAQGGLYKSTNGGTTWTPLFEFQLESLAIGAITIDPVDSNIVYVGTGEPNLSADSFAGRGVYIIRNANSASPTLTGPFRFDAAMNDVFTGRAIGRIVVNPSDTNIMFVCTTSGTGGNPNTGPATIPPRGLYRSTNAQSGTPTFAQVQVTGVPTPNDRSMVDIVADPVNPNLMLVTVIGASGDGGVYRTANALDPTPTFTRTLTLVNGSTNGRAELTVTRNATNGTTFYTATGELNPAVCTGGNASRGGAVRRSTDGGLTWSATLSGSAGFCGGQCFYDIALAVTPDNQTIHLGGAARSGTAGLCNIDVMKRSTNGGTSFVRNDNGLHADEHALAIAPSNPNVVYTGSDGGIWRSTDNGTNWVSLNNSFYSATQFQSLALHPFDRYFLMGGTQDNGTNCLSTDGVTWTNCRGGDGGYAQIDQNAFDTSNVRMYHTFFNQTNSQIGFERAETTAFAWTFRGCSGTTSNNGIGCGNAVLFYAPMELGPGNPQTLYFGTDRLYRSTNRGDTMTLASQGPLVPVNATQGQVLTTIGISPQDDNVRIVGLRNGQVFATVTGSATLTDVTGANFPAPNPADPARKSIGRAVIDPNSKFTAYITFTSFGVPSGQHIFKTTNLNDPVPAWTPAGNGIPDVPVSALIVDPQDSNSLYAGTDIGVYHSSDGGANWSPFGAGLPRVAVFDVKLSNVQRMLRIATHGRGIWEIEVPGQKLPILRSGATTIVAEGCAPGNGAIDPGEDVTVSFAVNNIGAGPTSNLTVTLLPTGGVTNPDGPQNYGAVQPGVPTARNFKFTASGTCGGTITLTFHLQDGATDFGNVTVDFTLGQLVTGAPVFTENFDGVTAPALPGGWTTANTGAAAAWVTSNTSSSSAPNSAFGAGAATPSSNNLDSPVIAIPAAPGIGTNPGVRLTFRNSYNTEGGFDGGVLEISINGGPFTDIITAGGSFIEGGYNGSIGVTDSVLTGRAAWTGTSGGFITTTVVLPAASYGQNAQFRWRTAYDTGTHPAGGGLRIDDISIYTATRVCCSGQCVITCPANVGPVPNDPGLCSAVVNYPAPTYTGNCGVVAPSQASGTAFPVGTTTVTVTATRYDGSTADSCTFDVTVNDAESPVVSAAAATPNTLWPPEHQMVPITVNYTATDNCSVGCVLTVTSNEPADGLGDGDTSPDSQVIDPHHVLVRSERSAKGTGRIYTITVTCADPAGNTIVRTTTVKVPKSQARTATTVDSTPRPPASTTTTPTTTTPNAPAVTPSATPGRVVYVPYLNGSRNRAGSTAQNKASTHRSVRKKKRTKTVSAR